MISNVKYIKKKMNGISILILMITKRKMSESVYQLKQQVIITNLFINLFRNF